LNEENNREIGKLFHSLTSVDPSDPVVPNRPIKAWGRTLLVPESTSKVAKFTFDELCGKALSAADYLEVTRTFGTVFLLDVPKMGMEKKDLARRFITFIDGASLFAAPFCQPNLISL
jgi:peroxisome-assembly ATPase